MARFAAALWFFGTLAISTLAAVIALPADAPAKQTRPAPVKEEVAAREVGEPIMAIVSLQSERVTFYDADGWIARAPVSTGIKGRETPAGVFAVIEKDRDHSTMYDDAWMPNMQRITWDGIALHGGPTGAGRSSKKAGSSTKLRSEWPSSSLMWLRLLQKMTPG